MDIFQSKPEAQDAIDAATSKDLLAPNIGANLDLCDYINSKERDTTELSRFVKALKKKLTSGNPKIVLLTLSLLDMCMMNCHRAFHAQVGTKDFMKAMVTVATSSSDVDCRTKALHMIRQWGVGYESAQSTLPEFYATYSDMLAHHVTFPDPDADAPLFTPPGASPPSSVSSAPAPAPVKSQRSQAQPTSSPSMYPAAAPPAAAAPAPLAAAAPAPSQHLRSRSERTRRHEALQEQLDQLATEFDTLMQHLQAVRSAVVYFAGLILSGTDPGDDNWLDAEDFLQQCRPRLMDLITAGTAGSLNDELFAVSLDVNDHLIKVLGRAQGGDNAATDEELANLVHSCEDARLPSFITGIPDPQPVAAPVAAAAPAPSAGGGAGGSGGGSGGGSSGGVSADLLMLHGPPVNAGRGPVAAAAPVPAYPLATAVPQGSPAPPAYPGASPNPFDHVGAAATAPSGYPAPNPFGPAAPVAPAPNPFGPAPVAPAPNPFGPAPVAPAPNPFGPAPAAPAPNPFGPSPAAPAPNPFGPAPVAPAANPFGPAPLGPAPNPFGQPAVAPASTNPFDAAVGGQANPYGAPAVPMASPYVSPAPYVVASPPSGSPMVVPAASPAPMFTPPSATPADPFAALARQRAGTDMASPAAPAPAPTAAPAAATSFDMAELDRILQQ